MLEPFHHNCSNSIRTWLASKRSWIIPIFQSSWCGSDFVTLSLLAFLTASGWLTIVKS